MTKTILTVFLLEHGLVAKL